MTKLPEGPYTWGPNGPIEFTTAGIGNVGVTLEDVAISLAATVRFRGMSTFFYSVADHCIRGAALMRKLWEEDDDFQSFIRDTHEELSEDTGLDMPVEEWFDSLTLAFLLHDVAEAIIGDIPAPFKKLLTITEPGYEPMPVDEWEVELMAKVAYEIAPGFEMPLPGEYDEEWGIVKMIDEYMFILEAEEMVGMPKEVTRGKEGYDVELPEAVEDSRDWFAANTAVSPVESAETWATLVVALYNRFFGIGTPEGQCGTVEGHSEGQKKAL